MKNNPEPRRIRGSVLMIAVWSLSILAMLAVSAGVLVRQRLNVAGKLTRRDKLHYIAEAGVERGLSILSTGDPKEGLGSLASRNVEFLKKSGVGKDGTFSCRITDEEGKININTTKYGELGKLFEIATGLDEKRADDLAAAIIDWRDKDDFPLINGAESRYYRSLRRPYPSKNSSFQVMEELMLVRDVTQKIYEKTEPYITLYGDGQVNINTAEKTVLMALGVDDMLVDKIISFRLGKDGRASTYDDNIFVSSGVAATLSQAVPVSASEVAKLTNLVSAGKLGITSNNFRLDSVGRLHNRSAALKIVCIFDRSKVKSGETAIKYWRERYFAE